MRPTAVVPAPPPRRQSDDKTAEEHIHDAVDLFEARVGRDATPQEVASIVSSVANHGDDSSSMGGVASQSASQHDHSMVARKSVKDLLGRGNLLLGEERLAEAEAQFQQLSQHLADAAEMHGDLDGFDSDDESNDYESNDYVDEVDEGLGEDWEDTPWVRPSREKAAEYRRFAMFESGRAPIWDTGMHDLAAFGDGIHLYLSLLRTLAIVFAIMSIVSAPAFSFSSAGSRIAAEKIDPFMFGLVSIGNIGENLAIKAASSDLSVVNGTLISSGSLMPAGSRVTYPALVGDPSVRIQGRDAGLIIVICDLVCCLIMLCVARWLQLKVAASEAGRSHETLSASDYTVFVRGLPEDATKQEIVAHFSNLFALDRPDWSFPGYCKCCHVWQKKPRLPDAITNSGHVMYDEEGNEVILVQTIQRGPTQNVDNTRDKLFLNTWVADCTVIHPNSKIIQEYQKQKDVELRLRTARAHAKKYSSGSLVEQTLNGRKRAKWMKIIKELEGREKSTETSIQRKVSRIDYKQKACSGAFVTFQHEESFIRCLEDYGRSHTRIGRWLQPDALRFRPRRRRNPSRKQPWVPLQVEQADEPTNIIWENLNTPESEVAVRRCCTILPCILLLVLMMLVVFYVQMQAKSFKNSTPSLASCQLDIPATYIGTYDNISSHVPYYSKEKSTLCPSETDHWISFKNSSMNATGWTAEAQLDIQLSRRNNSNFTSDVGPTCVTPCVSVSDYDSCDTLACDLGPSYDRLCKSFTRNAIVGCYCKSTLEKHIYEYGLTSHTFSEFTEETGAVCQKFLASYASIMGLSFGMSFILVIVNGILRILLTLLARCEHHHSEGAESAAVSLKVFAAQFMNTGLTMLVVNAALQDYVPSLFLSLGIGNGDYPDFTSEWFAMVGSYICLTMLMNTVTPNFLTWLHLACGGCKRAAMRERAVTQRQLNLSYSGRVFKLEYRYPTLLNVVFVSFLYSAGMPILYPIGALTFTIMYLTDKVALLRLYNRPPKYKVSLAKLAYRSIPIAVVLHLIFAVWIYGGNLLESYSLHFSAGENETMTVSVAAETFLGIGANITSGPGEDHTVDFFSRINKLNGFLPFALLFLICLLAILRIFVWWWVTLVFKVLLRIISCGLCASGVKVAPERKHLPGFTEPHITKSLDAVDTHLTSVEKKMGWIIRPNKDGVLERFKVWMKDGVTAGQRHVKGDTKKTWEVIRDTALHTYEITANPNYMDAFSSRTSISNAVEGALHTA